MRRVALSFGEHDVAVLLIFGLWLL
jgi:hypothetical protein